MNSEKLSQLYTLDPDVEVLSSIPANRQLVPLGQYSDVPKRTMAAVKPENLCRLIAARFLSELSEIGIVPVEVPLNGKMKFRPLNLTPDVLTRMPQEGHLLFDLIKRMRSILFFSDWMVLEEVPPPVRPRSYKIDPHLVFRLGNKYYSVFHWD